MKYLTSDDEKRIGEFLARYLPRFLPVRNDPLYHYTTGENLIRIIESQELWATQVSCLNDTTELVYAADELCKRVRSKLQALDDQTTSPYLRRFADALSNPYAETSGTFVTCFSECRDDLSQWRAYSGGEGGYAIQFDRARLLLGQDQEFPDLIYQVEYEPETHSIIFDEVLECGQKFFVELESARQAPNVEAWADEFVNYWIQQLAHLAPCFKNPKFATEKECRLIRQLHPDDVKPDRMHFRQRQSMMSRHISLRLRKPLPIAGVLVGPCRHPLLSRIAVGDLLKTAGYDPDVVRVQITEVPYRAA
jgi:Protein of unknown function (DUF2971)